MKSIFTAYVNENKAILFCVCTSIFSTQVFFRHKGSKAQSGTKERRRKKELDLYYQIPFKLGFLCGKNKYSQGIYKTKEHHLPIQIVLFISFSQIQ
ncbi:hypothetical protein [Parasediminibacterium sp. JCM 36343]|uniref:hypothetical protein n=1 Tax=Parasediminibacterium sp. JCM 36343 TaxID=3374279 RepID=UPI0039797AD1